MKVLQVIDNLTGGGQERVAVELASALQPYLDSSALLATRAGGDYEAELRERGVNTLVLNRRGRADLQAWRRAAAWLRENEFDIVHTHNPGSLANLLVLRRVFGVPFRLVAHLQMLPPRGTLQRHVASWIHKWAKGHVRLSIVTNDTLRRTLLEGGHEPDTVEILINPVDFSRFSIAAERGGGRPTICMVAQWRRQKDQLTAIRAAAILRKRGFEFNMLLIGEGDVQLKEAAAHLIEAENIPDVVSIAGRRSDIPDVLARVDVGLLATHFEGLPVALIEYCAASLPVVVSEVEGTDFLVDATHGIRGVPPADPVALADALGDILTMPHAARLEMGNRARVLMRPKADAPAVIARLLTLYERVLSE